PRQATPPASICSSAFGQGTSLSPSVRPGRPLQPADQAGALEPLGHTVFVRTFGGSAERVDAVARGREKLHLAFQPEHAHLFETPVDRPSPALPSEGGWSRGAVRQADSAASKPSSCARNS